MPTGQCKLKQPGGPEAKWRSNAPNADINTVCSECLCRFYQQRKLWVFCLTCGQSDSKISKAKSQDEAGYKLQSKLADLAS